MRKPFSYYISDYTFLFSISGLILILDQLTKELVRSSLAYGDSWAPIISLTRYFRFVHWQNTGAAFGIFQDGNVVFMLLGIFVTLAIINFFPIIPRDDRWLRAALALQLGGALGNLVDRIIQGHVTDFFSFMRFPVFNIADASIFIGVLLILIPIIPQISEEMEQNRQIKMAQDLNKIYRTAGSTAASKVEEPLSLGLIEVLLADAAFLQAFILEQDVRRLRTQNNLVRKGTSRG